MYSNVDIIIRNILQALLIRCRPCSYDHLSNQHLTNISQTQRCSESLSSYRCSSPEVCFFTDTGVWKDSQMNGNQKCTSKGIGRRGVVLKHRNSLQRSLWPVALCPHLRSSDKQSYFGPNFLGSLREISTQRFLVCGFPVCGLTVSGVYAQSPY